MTRASLRAWTIVWVVVALLVLPASRSAAATFVVNNTGDAADASAGNGVCATAGAVCTLRAAIEEANALAGADTITFNIGAGGLQTIAPASALPTISTEIDIDGTTQPGFAGTPLIKLLGTSAARQRVRSEHHRGQLVDPRPDRRGLRQQGHPGRMPMAWWSPATTSV